MSNFMTIRPVGAELPYADGQRGMTKVKIAFRNSAKAPKNESTVNGCQTFAK
jgi:hypothetical protein